LLDDNRWEYLLAGEPAAVARAEVEIELAKGRILRGDELPALGLSQRAIDLDNRVTLAAMRRRLARRGIEVVLDRNTIFTPASEGRTYASDLLGAPETGGCRLPRAIRIGLIDGPVDTAQGDLASVPVVSRSVLDDADEPADPDHATGLVSLIAAPAGGAVLSGLAVGANIFDAIAFSSDGDRNGMRLDHFARALDWLIAEHVDIVNMSITGPRNRVLALLLTQADAQGAILIAATGNEGRSQVAFPAADPHVIAITAIDARLKLFRSANTGNEVDFAAPGVDLLVVGEGGGGYRSGTSYAAAIASAVIAHEIGKGNRRREDIIAALRQRAQDLGAPGRDAKFGWGLLRLSGC
jgi:subtilisin family serine protease